VRVGYASVSRKDERLEAQREALLTDGCKRVFEEKVSSREADRKALREAFDYCHEGDVLVVRRSPANLPRAHRRIPYCTPEAAT
jgi:DNA invertase Pin-like site-specific DNA recombinase